VTLFLVCLTLFLVCLFLVLTGVKVMSLHHDISTVTGEEVILFTLAESVLFRETKKKQAL
jgi:uncharacterized protein YbcI